MKRFSLCFFVAALCLTPTGMRAQIGIYGAVSGATFSNAPKDLGYGGMVGIYKQAGHAANFVSAGLDLRGTFVGRDGFHDDTYAIGPRIAFNPHVIPLHPYVEGLVGIADYNSGRGTGSSAHLNYQVVGGLDAALLPRVQWRVVDIAYSGVASQSIRAVTFSTGLVIRIW